MSTKEGKGMTLNRRSFLSVLAGAACSVLGAVYGVSRDEDEEAGEYWKLEANRWGPVTQEKLEAVFGRQYDLAVKQKEQDKRNIARYMAFRKKYLEPRSNFVLT